MVDLREGDAVANDRLTEQLIGIGNDVGRIHQINGEASGPCGKRERDRLSAVPRRWLPLASRRLEAALVVAMADVSFRPGY